MQVEDIRMSQLVGSTRIRYIAQSVEQLSSAIHWILKQLLCYYSYKVSLFQEFLPADFSVQVSLVVVSSKINGL